MDELIKRFSKWKNNYIKLADKYPVGSRKHAENISYASLLTLVIGEIVKLKDNS